MSLANSPFPDLYPGNNSRPNPRALLFFLSSQESYRQPLFSTEEVFCGPDTESRNVANRLSALKVPPGSFDVRDVVLALPASQQPEIVIVKADVTARNLPRNLGQLKCPKILLVGDTHHLRRPVQALLRYAMEEPFDFVIFDHTRHHAHFFAEAGAKNVHWLPAVDYGFFPRKLVRKPSRPLTFVGQAGRYHPYRSWVLGQVKAAGLPLEVLRGALAETADLYADSQITLNVSLNGDLNLRVFEALAAGGFLLTDELPEHSGLPLLFKSDKHLATWRTPEELIEKIRYYLAHPAEAQRIRAAGQAEILRAHHPEVKLREFYDLVFSGKVNPVYDLSRDHRCARSLGKAALSPLTDNDPIIAAYEAVQELHRVSRQVTVFCSAPAELSRLADLPRLYFRPLADLCGFEPAAESTVPKAEAVIWAENISASVLANHLLTFAGHVIAPNGSAAVVETLELCGYSPIETGSVLFRLARPLQALQRAWDANEHEHVRGRLASVLPTLPDSNDCLTLAHLADQLEERTLKRAAIEQAMSLDRCNQAALICSAADLLDDEDAAAALLRLEEAARIAPLTPEVEQLRAGLFAELGQHGSLAPYYRMIGRTPVPPAERPRRILVVTNLFPPQELGGYGRKIWEFSNGLIKRGHHLKVLTGDARYLQKTPDAGEPDLELLVERNLVLQGEWKNGLVHKPGGVNFIRCTARDNKRKVMVAVAAFKPDFVLLGNLDFLGVDMLKAIIAEKIPVLHSLGNQTPAYGPHESIESPLYRIAPASDWLGENLLKQGYKVPKLSTIYPGARLDRFFKVFLPDIRRLRIVFAGLVMPFKGAHILMAALHLLKQSGIEFEADFAGDSTDEDYVRKLKEFAQNNGLTAKVRFNGFLDRGGLTALFARCNVLVFPTQVPEAFGISQVEAMASGLIVITSGTGGTQEVIRHEIDGLVFEMGNAVSLANNLAKLATDKELRNKLQIGAQKRAMQFSVTDSIVRIEKIAGEILSSDSLSSFAKKESVQAPPKNNPPTAATTGIDCGVAETAISPVPKNDKIGVYLYSHEAEIGAPTFPAIRQTYFSRGVVGKFKFSEKLTEEATFIVTFGGPSLPEVAKKFPKKNRICVLMENPRIWMPSPQYMGEMGIVVCPFPIPVPKGTKLIINQAAVPWFYGIKFRTDVGLLHAPAPANNLELQDLAEMTKHPKDKLISCIASRKTGTPGHQWRFQVAQALKNHFGQNIDLFGFGWNPIAEKRDAIDRYHYTVVIENDESDHYWTEKLSDAILGYSVPIYAGARKVNNYFAGGVHNLVHGGSVDETIKEIARVADAEPSGEYLHENRHKILFKYNFYYMLANILVEH